MNKIEFDNNIYDTIRKNIRKYRKERKITCAELAEMVGLSHEFLADFQQWFPLL